MAYEQKKAGKLPKKTSRDGYLPDTADGWVKYVNELHSHGLTEKRKYEFQWIVNLAYYMGYQHLLFNPRSGLLELPREMKQPLIINRVKSFTDARHAKLTKNRPFARVLPNTPDTQDKGAAKAADNMLTYLWRKIDMDTEYDKLVKQMLICGTAFMKVLWDPLTGDFVTDYQRGGREADELVIGDDGEIAMDKVFLGEVSSVAVSPFSLLPANDSLLDLKDQPWILERAHSSICELEKRFPKLKGKIQKEDSSEVFTEYEKILQRLSSPVFKTVGTSGFEIKDELNSQVLVKTAWIKPNEEYEQGVVAVVVGKELAFIDKFPNDFGGNIYPFIKFQENEDGFHFWNQSTIENLIPIQKAYNKISQKKLKNICLMANGKWLLPKGSQVMEDAITDEEGEIIEYNSAVPAPQQAAIASMPNYVTEFHNRLLTDFRDVGGQRESSVTPPVNITAGVAMQTAAELADEIIGPIVRRLSRGMEKVSNIQLLLMDQEYIEPRLVKIIGDRGPVSVMWLSSTDLRHHTDVHVEIESMFPEFRGAKRQTLMDLWDRRIIQDPQKLLQAFRFGSFENLLDDEEALEEMVGLDIQRIKNGKQPEISQFQNHQLYVKKLSQWIQTPDFAKLIPERKQLAIAILQQHLQILMGQMQGPQGEPQPEQNQAAVGTPFGPVKPPQQAA